MLKQARTPSYRRHKPSGQAVVSIDGRTIYLGRYRTVSSRNRYDAVIGEWLANGRRAPPDGGSLTVVELVARYWDHVNTYYSKNGRPTVELGKMKVALRTLRRMYGTTPADEFGPLKLKAIRQTFIDAGWCRRHVNQQTGKLKRVFKWATENELVPPSTYHALQAVAGLKRGRTAAGESAPILPAPEAHIAAAQQHTPAPVRAMIDLQLLTGMRPGEVRIMRARDLDTTGLVWTYTPSEHKTEHLDRERSVYLGPRAQEALEPFLQSSTSAYLFSPYVAREARYHSQRCKRKTRVQPSQTNRRKRRPKKFPGDHYGASGYRQAIRRACIVADVPPWTPAQLRHNAATRFRKEYGLEVAQIMLGHATAEVTQIYAERDRDRAISVVARIG